MEEYKIYRIVCNETNEVYFGKTTQTLQERLCRHKSIFNTTSSKQIILRNNYYLEEINSTFDEEESVRLERYYIETFDCVNQLIPGRTRKEWLEENSEYFKEYKKQYREENSEYISEYMKKWREENPEYMKEYMKKYYKENTEYMKEYMKKWREENVEYLKKYEKERYEERKEYMKEYRKAIYTCECGSTLTVNHKARHERESKKHINFINSK